MKSISSKGTPSSTTRASYTRSSTAMTTRLCLWKPVSTRQKCLPSNDDRAAPTQGPPFQEPRLCIARGEWALSERALIGSDTWIGNDTWKGNGFSMASFERTIEINVPVSTAYNQWTQFEELQRFM